jgi:hypothetical protein
MCYHGDENKAEIDADNEADSTVAVAVAEAGPRIFNRGDTVIVQFPGKPNIYVGPDGPAEVTNRLTAYSLLAIGYVEIGSDEEDTIVAPDASDLDNGESALAGEGTRTHVQEATTIGDRLLAAEEDTGFKLGQKVQITGCFKVKAEGEVVGFARVNNGRDEEGNTDPVRKVVVRLGYALKTPDGETLGAEIAVSPQYLLGL